MSVLSRIAEIVCRTDTAYLDAHWSCDVSSDQIAQELHGAVRAEVLAEAADDLEAQTCGCGCRRGADLLRRLAAEAGKDTHPGESTQAAELTVYRAEHDSIVMGLYTTVAEASAHCVAEERRAWSESEDPVFDWIEDDEDGVAELVTVDEDTGFQTLTGYVVTALTVASKYDDEADA